MKAFYFLILVPLFFSCGNNKNQSIPNQNSKKQFAINFKLVNKSSSLRTYDLGKDQFSAIVKFTNQNGPSIKMPTYLEFGHKSSIYSFYFEAFDLNNNEVDLETAFHPDWFPTDMVLFSKGDILIDTIQSGDIFKFKKIGIYKLRVVFDPNKFFRSEGKISKEIIFSNWDTLTVK